MSSPTRITVNIDRGRDGTTAPISTDGTFAANSDSLVPSQKAAKTLHNSSIGTATQAALDAKLARVAHYHASEFGVVGDGTTDDLADMQAALDFVAGLGGGIVDITGLRVLIDSADLEIPANVFVIGPYLNIGEETARSWSTLKSCFVLNSSYTIRLADRQSGIKGVGIFRKGLTTPTSLAEATTALAAFAGTAVTFGDGVLATATDCYAGYLFIMGFAQAIKSDGNERPRIEYVSGDNTAGIWLSECYDMNHLVGCHFWPYLTIHEAWSLDGADGWHRSGTAYFLDGSVAPVDWGQARDCFSYGYQTGFDVVGCDQVTLVNCGADSYPTGGLTTTVGFNIRGSSRAAALIGCKAAGQGSNYVIDIDDTVMEVTVLEGCRSWGSLTWEYDFVQGSAKVIGCIAQDSKAIRYQSGVVLVSFSHCYFPSVAFTGTADKAEFTACTGPSDNRVIASTQNFHSTASNPSQVFSQYGTGEGWESSFRKSRGTLATPATVNNGDIVYDFATHAHDGSNFLNTSIERYDVIGTPATGNVITRKRFLLRNTAGSFEEPLRLQPGPSSAQAAISITVNNGSSTTLKTVEVGAADSGGAGYRVLRVTN